MHVDDEQVEAERLFHCSKVAADQHLEPSHSDSKGTKKEFCDLFSLIIEHFVKCSTNCISYFSTACSRF